MRTSVKLAAFIFMVTAVISGQNAFAQGPMGYGAPPPGNYSPVGWGQMPADGFNPWPTVSPFENKFSQHVNQNGLWFADSQGATAFNQRKYFFGVEVLSSTTREDTGLIGNEGQQTYYEQVFDALVTATDQQYAEDFQSFNFFSAVDGSLAGNLEGTGMRIRTGWFNSDDSGFQFEGTWSGQVDSRYDARDASTTFSPFPATDTGPIGTPQTQTGFASRQNELDLVRRLLSPPDFLLTDIEPVDVDQLLQRNLLNLGGLPIDNGSFAGVTIPFDLNFVTEFKSQFLGGGLSYIMTPVIKTDGFMLRPVVGVRYMNVDESFRFTGEDSGTLYDDTVAGTADPTPDLKLQSIPDGVDNDGDGIIDNGAIAEDSTTFAIGNLTAVAIGDPFGSSIINSFTLSESVSHLAGPELGFRYDLGGDNMKIWGQTKVGLLVNHERLRLSGDNIGVGTRIEPGFDGITPAIPTELFAPTEDNPNPNAFSDSADTTHVSPIFEQQFVAEIPIFDFIPVLRDSRSFEGARLRLGYSFTFIDHIASNSQSIIWQGNPQAGLFPELDIERRSWWTQNWSAGLEWRY